MKPKIDSTKFGSVTVNGKEFSNDIIIRLNGNVEKRKKKLSKKRYGSSHTISLEEAEHIFEPEVRKLIIGTGQTGFVELSPEAAGFFRENECEVQLLPTPEAIIAWNDAEGQAIGMFHVTC